MLRDRYRQLLTAYVDGELSSRQRRHVVRLLRRSPEARQLLHQLQEDAQAIRQLPRPTLPEDLSSPVLRNIAERRLTPGRRHIVRTASTSAWMGPLASWAAAAAVLFLLGVASYLYFVSSLDQPSDLHPPTASRQRPTATTGDRSRIVESNGQTTDRKPQDSDGGQRVAESAQPTTDNRKRPPKDGSRILDSQKAVTNKPPLPPKQESALTERLETFQFERVLDLLPAIVKLSDLESAAGRRRFLTELRKDHDFRIELPCTNGGKALDRVQKAARTLHFGLILDKQAQERIKSKWRGNFALYVEDLMPEELIRFVRQIATEDRKSAANKPAEAQIDRLVLTRMTARHRKELSALLGVDPAAATPSPKGPLGADPRTPLSDATARQLEKALAGQGGTPRPASGKSAAKPPEHMALVLPYNSARSASGSEEIKHYLDSRKPARAGTLRVLLVLRAG